LQTDSECFVSQSIYRSNMSRRSPLGTNNADTFSQSRKISRVGILPHTLSDRLGEAVNMIASSV
jgi:hypothetical protein